VNSNMRRHYRNHSTAKTLSPSFQLSQLSPHRTTRSRVVGPTLPRLGRVVRSPSTIEAEAEQHRPDTASPSRSPHHAHASSTRRESGTSGTTPLPLATPPPTPLPALTKSQPESQPQLQSQHQHHHRRSSCASQTSNAAPPSPAATPLYTPSSAVYAHSCLEMKVSTVLRPAFSTGQGPVTVNLRKS
jgi:hypothetical protein